MRVTVSPKLLKWAQERSQIEHDDLCLRFRKLAEWETGEIQPTLKQLEKFAKAVHVPVGYLFLPEPPEEQVPIPDFRTLANREVRRPSPNLLDMLYHCLERQSWYKEFAQISRQEPRAFVGSLTVAMSPVEAAQVIRSHIGFDLETRQESTTWEDALRLFIQLADQTGVLVMVSGVVLSNTSRKLDPQEFRGFALADPLAPLVFINGSDSKSAQMFTLAHELAHIWLNSSGVSDVSGRSLSGYPREEVWCNAVAAELLVPMSVLVPTLRSDETVDQAKARLSRAFKVSSFVVLRRLLDAEWLARGDFEQAWLMEKARLRGIAGRSSGGGNFYRTTVSRVSRRFTQALIISTLEGQTLYRDAFRMLGVAKTETFNNLGREVGVML